MLFCAGVPHSKIRIAETRLTVMLPGPFRMHFAVNTLFVTTGPEIT
jgi:hypothetical protein